MNKTILKSGFVVGAAVAMSGCAAQSGSMHHSMAQKAMNKAQSAQQTANSAQQTAQTALKRANNAQNTAQKAMNTSKANSKRMKRMFKQSQEK